MKNYIQAIKLLRNRLYPTYQLHAYMANKKTSPEDGLKIAILTVLEWIRARLVGPIPPELDLPGHESYSQVPLESFQSIHVNYGYVIDIISMLDKGIWTLQITEPDLGSEPGNPQQKRQPVPGRVLETNISFSIQGDQLECGTQIVISDPDHTLEKAEVYRPTIVKRLASNPDFGLKNIIPLEPNVKTIDTLEQLKRMLDIYHQEDNQMPLVLFTRPQQQQMVEEEGLPLASLTWEELHYNCGSLCLSRDFTPAVTEEEKKQLSFTNPYELLADHEQAKNHLYHDYAKEAKEAAAKKKQSKKSKLTSKPLEFLKVVAQNPYLPTAPKLLPQVRKESQQELTLTYTEPPYDCQGFAYSALGYAQVYLLEPQLLSRLQQQEKLAVEPGDILILEPQVFGGCISRLPLSRAAENYSELREKILKYPREKRYNFKHLSFLSHARDILIDYTKQIALTTALQEGKWQEYLQQQENSWYQKLRERDLKINLLNEQLTQLRQELQQEEQAKEALRQQITAAKQANAQRLEQQEDYIRYYQRKLDLPANHAAIPQWVEKYFGNRLYLHPKAVALLEDKSAQIVDLRLICDALDYLATEYWSQRYAKLAKAIAQLNCSKKYQRPFEVTPVGQSSICLNPGQYRVKYQQGKGKPVEMDLDTHLKVGNDSELLLRIYFFHDDAKQLIVVGSLPRHLKNATIK